MAITKESMTDLIWELSKLMEQSELTHKEAEVIESMRIGAMYLFAAIENKIGVGLNLINLDAKPLNYIEFR